MSLNRAEIKEVVDELDEKIRGSSCQKVRAIAADPLGFVLEYYQPATGVLRLRCSCSPGASRIHLTANRSLAPQTPPAFIMFLRKHLHGGHLQTVKQLNDDRVVILVHRRGEHTSQLILELTDRHANAFFVENERIVIALRNSVSKKRNLRRNQPYQPPISIISPLKKSRFQRELSFSSAIDAKYSESEQEKTLDTYRVERLRLLKKEKKRLQVKIKAIRKDITKIKSAAEMRRRGELLQTAYGKVKRGATSAMVIDFYAENTPIVEIPLDPKRSLKDNIERYFHQYRRYKRGRVIATKHLVAAEDDLARILHAMNEIQLATEMVSIQRLLKTFVPKLAKEQQITVSQTSIRQKKSLTRLPYHHFKGAGESDIFVGRGGKDNDKLTFQVARADDIWLHVADWPGAHVLVRMIRGKEISSQTLLEAAQLAAFYSKAKSNTIVTVTWTQRRNIRKPKGLSAGRVMISKGRSIDVRPDQVLIDRLMANRF